MLFYFFCFAMALIKFFATTKSCDKATIFCAGSAAAAVANPFKNRKRKSEKLKRKNVFNWKILKWHNWDSAIWRSMRYMSMGDAQLRQKTWKKLIFFQFFPSLLGELLPLTAALACFGQHKTPRKRNVKTDRPLFTVTSPGPSLSLSLSLSPSTFGWGFWRACAAHLGAMSVCMLLATKNQPHLPPPPPFAGALQRGSLAFHVAIHLVFEINFELRAFWIPFMMKCFQCEIIDKNSLNATNA